MRVENVQLSGPKSNEAACADFGQISVMKSDNDFGSVNDAIDKKIFKTGKQQSTQIVTCSAYADVLCTRLGSKKKCTSFPFIINVVYQLSVGISKPSENRLYYSKTHAENREFS